MNRIIKNPDSEVILKNMKYKKSDTKVLKATLLQEQKGFCAYTQEYIDHNDAHDVEHFNPNLKYQEADSYNNWFAVKHKPNNIKSNKWLEPILHPTAEDFEARIIYHDGYFLSQPEDIEAQNLIHLLSLNDVIFVQNRKKYINRRKDRVQEKGVSARVYFQEKIDAEIDSIKYLRAIQEEFKIDIWEMLPMSK